MPNTGAHILVYPYPGSGHIIPFLNLTRGLLSRGLTVTALVTPNNLHLLDPFLSPSLQPLVLPCPPMTPNLLQIMRALRELHYPLLLQWFQSQASPPVVIFSDFFLGWTQRLASELGVPRVVFSPTSVFSFCYSISMCREPPRIDNPDDENCPVSFPGIPTSPEYPCYQISIMYRCRKEGEPEREFYRDNWLANLESWGVVFNSFTDLEGIYIEHMKKEMGHDRVWATGPVMTPDEGDAGAADAIDLMSRGGSSSVSCQELMAWLDARQDHSVVYGCFGSHQVLTRKQMEVLVAGFEQSGVHFIWCVREPRHPQQQSSDHGVVPEGFEDRVAGKGFLIRGWAPQMAILRHRAVGAFLTHCGWNSSLEGIVAGALMLAWPMAADQFTNTKLVVDQKGIGIRVGESTQNIPESSKLARVLVESLDGARPERVAAKRMREAAMGAVKGGTSEKDLDAFVKAVNQLKTEKRP